MKEQLLVDQYGRQLNYLRLSVTDRCNFRCYYCMPEEGINFASRTELLSFDELYTLSSLFCNLGVDKIRITGGEPFIRVGIDDFLYRLSAIPALKEITVTTNGTLTYKQQQVLKDTGVRKINISLDSLNAERFRQITRRDSFKKVYEGIFNLLADGFEIKLNCVVAEGKNIEDIIPFIELTKAHALAVRFLEEMPFNGSLVAGNSGWDHQQIYNYIASAYAHINRLPAAPSSTSVNYQVEGYRGSFGIIPSFSRTFCGACNRIRLSATGDLRTCLYGPPAANLRDATRSGTSMDGLMEMILDAVAKRKRDGFEAEEAGRMSIHTSMSVLGG
ncbi:GTP 3',8-cyclase MoaA [Mucilaginibacter sp. RS28]|uniref:GTP 3',8-cyclase n=1 Tax=Mucilaginibacter straminoryzae TaxID=2932774 RepID=A0A9X1X3T6_9SPHI|nr:GTP 3',8-cyclase MoaA [Mucilaginibacter straminoryzae]MCJ8210051.1 GTP 3',8-cyclase MoaA [Mucilaginibacter straminoryzae]